MTAADRISAGDRLRALGRSGLARELERLEPRGLDRGPASQRQGDLLARDPELAGMGRRPLMVQVDFEIQTILELAATSAGGPVAEYIASDLLGRPMSRATQAPAAVCAALGTSHQDGTSLSAGFALLLLSVRWLDDVHDRDKVSSLARRVGPDRASTLAMAAHALAWSVLACDPVLPRSVLRMFGACAARMAKGQDWDLRGGAKDLAEHWTLSALKTAAMTEGMMACAARAAGATEEDAQHLSRFGHHLGQLVQLRDDFDDTFITKGKSDLDKAQPSFPLLLALEGPERIRVRAELEGPGPVDASRLRHLLIELGVPGRLLALAIEQARAARKSLAKLKPTQTQPAQEALAWLHALPDRFLSDLDPLLAPPAGE